ncbi:hypothetical protein MMC32_004219 [Xylographa parallela]|nr:hypothetical protein [Xylographa parallela]
MHLSLFSLQVLSLLLALHSLPALSAPSMFEELEQHIEHKTPQPKREAPAPPDTDKSHAIAAAAANAAAVAANFLPYPGSALTMPTPIAAPAPAKEAKHNAPAQKRQAPAPPADQAVAAAANPPAPDPAAAPPNPAPPPDQNPAPIAPAANNRAALLSSKLPPTSTGTAAATSTATVCPGIGAHNPDMPDKSLSGYKPPADTNPVPGAWTVACGTLTDQWTMSDTFYLSGPPVQLSWVLDSGEGSIGVVGNVSEDPVVMVPVVRFVAVTAEQKRLGSFVPRPGVAYSVQLAGTPTRVGVSWWLNLV